MHRDIDTIMENKKPNTAILISIFDWISLNFNTKTPSIAGINIKKENLAAIFWLHPNSKAMHIVAPDLDIPGSNASTCARPIAITSKKDNSIFLGFTYLVAYRINALNKKING